MGYADMLFGESPKREPTAAPEQTAGYADLVLGEAPKEAPPEAAYDPEKSAGLGATAVASFANDANARLRYYAEKRGISPDKYRLVEGDDGAYRPAYQADDGKWYYEEPLSRFPRSMKEWGQREALTVGELLPIAAETVTGIVSAPAMLSGVPGMAASMAATGAAGAAGQTAREGIANLVMDQPVSGERIATEGAYGALTQGIGAGFTALGQRGAAKDIDRLNRVAMSELEKKGAKFGVPLTPAETSNLPSLKASQKALGNLPQSADDMAKFYTARGEKVSKAVGGFLDDVSPTDSAEVAGKQIKGAAEKVYQEAIETRKNWAKPIYEKVVTAANRIPSRQFKTVADDKYTAAIVEKVKADPLLGMEKLPNNSMPVLDATYKHFSDLIEVAKRSGENNRVRLLTQKQEALRSMMDDAFPDYANARMAFEAGSRPIEALDDSIVSVIKELPGAKFQTAAQKLFDPKQSGSQAVSQARALLEKADPQAWQSIKRSWLQQQWETAGKEFVSSGSPVVNQGPKFRALLLGDESKRRIMKEALSPQEWRTLTDLADVLEAAGRVKPVGSDTAWNQEMMKVARSEATPALAKVARGLSPQKWGEMIEDWATERALSKNADKMAEIITSPGAAQRLKELRQLSPRSAQFRAGLAHLLTQGPRVTSPEYATSE